MIASTGTSHPICRLDHEAVLLCVSHRQRVSLVSAETGHIVSSVQVGADICGITWHLGSSIFVITGSSSYVSAFSRTMPRFYLRLGDDPTFMEQLNTDLILKSDFEEGSHISVFSYKNDLIISNGYYFVALGMPSGFEDIFSIPEIHLIKSIILLKSHELPSILQKLIPESRDHEIVQKQNENIIANFLDYKIKKMKEYVNWALGKSKHLNKNKFNEDVYKLMLPIQQHAFGKDPTLITD